MEIDNKHITCHLVHFIWHQLAVIVSLFKQPQTLLVNVICPFVSYANYMYILYLESSLIS